MTDLADLTAAEAAERIRSRGITSEALVRACLARIEAREAEVQAWESIDPDYALAQARALDQRQAAGEPIGLLHGLPVGVKDIIDTHDMATESGSAHFKGHRPERDAGCVVALRAAGAVIMGKTVTTELATRTPGKTRNPHNPAHTPGGSSSGSAAAVACGMVPLALGTQTGGSVVRPASFCGIHGLKPTLGLVSRSGVTLQSHTLDTVGTYGRSVADVGLITEALSVYDPTDDASYPRGRTHLNVAALADPPGRPRIGFIRTPAWEDAETDAKAAIEELAAALGGDCVEVTIPAPFDRICELQKIVQHAENAHHFAPLMAKDPSLFSDTLREILISAAQITAKDYQEAIFLREPLYRQLVAVFQGVDALVGLSACGPAPVTLASTGNPIFNGLWTFLGVPTINLPLMEIDGLPMGATLVGLRRGEGKLLSVARWVEKRVQGGLI